MEPHLVHGSLSDKETCNAVWRCGRPSCRLRSRLSLPPNRLRELWRRVPSAHCAGVLHLAHGAVNVPAPPRRGLPVVAFLRMGGWLHAVVSHETWCMVVWCMVQS